MNRPIRRLDGCDDAFEFGAGGSGADERKASVVAAMSEATRILQAVGRGDPKAAEELLPLVYEELRKLAASKMSLQPPNQTLQPTALVHEAYLKLLGDGEHSWKDRRHFFAAAAEAMR